MSTATDIDLEALYALGDEVEKHCEHSEHTKRPFQHSADGPLTYVQVFGCCGGGRVFSFCTTYVQYVFEFHTICNRCNEPLRDHYNIIGPVL